MSENSYRPNSRSVSAQPGDKYAPRVRVGYRLWLAWLAAFWERLWPALWLPASIAGLFAAFALYNIFGAVPAWLHIALLGLFLLGFVAALVLGIRRLTLPKDYDARRRLETATGLAHRPLTTVQDRLALGAGDKASEALWRAHVQQARSVIKSLRIGTPQPGVPRRDRFAVRGLVFVLLIPAVVIAWGDMLPRLGRALTPELAVSAADQIERSVEAWLTPPEYTGLPPRMLTLDNGDKPVLVPDGTKIMIQVHGGKGLPRLTLGKQAITFKPLDETSFQAEVLVKFPGELKVDQRGKVLSWPIEVIPDKPPEISFEKPPAAGERAVTRIEFKAKDDYGITKIRALITREADTAEVLVLDLPVTGKKDMKSATYHDLAGHPWAGSEVLVVLVAEDEVGNKGKSEVVKITLPERKFRNPVARAIQEQRKMLVADPDELRNVVRNLGIIAEQPKAYLEDIVVYMALRQSQTRLILADRARASERLRATTIKTAIGEVLEILWDTALRVEDGRLSQAEKELRDLQRQLQDKLSDKNTPDKELQQLMDKLQQALQDYLRELAEDMQKNPDKYANNPLDPDARQLSQQDFQQFMDQLRDMMQNNSREDMQRMLSQLQQLMEDLRNGRMQSQQQQQMDPNNPQMKALRDLQDMIRRQQQLMDKSHKQSQDQQNQTQRQQRENNRQLSEQQDQLQKDLGDLMKRLGEMMGQVPDNMGRAQDQMKGAQGQLDRNRPGDAVGPQGRAMQELMDGAQQMARQMSRQLGLGLGPGLGQPGPGQRWNPANRDPLGRNLDGMGPLNTEDVKVPTEQEQQRAREIQEELRRRASEPTRPQQELDYLERLLRRF
ncbi:MAG: TIGR02302 family protein [Alphaproteobacteria bacterium]